MFQVVYKKAFSEVLEILKYIPKFDYEKIPLEIIEIMEDNCSKDYNVEYNPYISLTEQNISEEAKTIIAVFFRDYWATEEQRKKILLKEYYDVEKIEKEKIEQFNTDNIFKNRLEKVAEENTNLPMEIKEETFFKKLLNFIRKFLKI